MHNGNIPVSEGTKMMSFKGKETRNVVVDVPAVKRLEHYVEIDGNIAKEGVNLINNYPGAKRGK